MPTDDKISRTMERARRAWELQDNELLNETFDYLSSAYIAQWKITRFDDTAGRDRLWQAVNCIAKVRDHFRIAVEDGKIAKADLERMQGLNVTN